MTRTLHNTLMALSTTGLLLVFGLMAASPLAPMPHADPLSGPAPGARTFEAEVAAAADTGHALALTAAFVAGTATEVAIAAAFADTSRDLESAGTNRFRSHTRGRPGSRSARNAIALPYFSFARGLRRGKGG